MEGKVQDCVIVVAMNGLYDAGAFSDFLGSHSILEIRVNSLQQNAPSDLPSGGCRLSCCTVYTVEHYWCLLLPRRSIQECLC